MHDGLGMTEEAVTISLHRSLSFVRLALEVCEDVVDKALLSSTRIFLDNFEIAHPLSPLPEGKQCFEKESSSEVASVAQVTRTAEESTPRPVAYDMEAGMCQCVLS